MTTEQQEKMRAVLNELVRAHDGFMAAREGGVGDHNDAYRLLFKDQQSLWRAADAILRDTAEGREVE